MGWTCAQNAQTLHTTTNFVWRAMWGREEKRETKTKTLKTWKRAILTPTRGRNRQMIDLNGELLSKSVVEERLVQYHKAHERRHSQPTVTSFQCFSCMTLCRSNAGLSAHRRAYSLTNTTVTHAPEPISIFCCQHYHSIFAARLNMVYTPIWEHTIEILFPGIL